MASSDSDTQRNDTPEQSAVGRQPFRALAYIGCVDLLDPKAPQLVWLDNLDRLTIGRPKPLWSIPEGRRDDIVVERTDGAVRVRVRDGRVSGLHATLDRQGERWRIRDEGSTNGTVVNGRPVTEHVLASGDIVEMGHTFWRYIEYLPLQPGLFARKEFVAFGPTRTVSPALHEALALLRLHAPGKDHSLILGDTGAGKEIAAAQVHAWSERAGKCHVINCATIPAQTAEGHLFGWVKGAHTGAQRDQEGHVEAAHGGTLVLDEIGDLSFDLQAKLLRVAEEGEMYRLGDVRPRRVDVRIVAVTHRDLPAMVHQGTFREDLYGRLAKHITRLPALRNRPEDIGGLVAQFLRECEGGADLGIAPLAMRRLLAYSWPQNVRQLGSVIHEAAGLARAAGVVKLQHVTLPAVAPPAEPAHEAGTDAESGLPRGDAEFCAGLDASLRRQGGNVAAVARDLGIKREVLYRRLRACRLDPRSYRGPRP